MKKKIVTLFNENSTHVRMYTNVFGVDNEINNNNNKNNLPLRSNTKGYGGKIH
jgi:hypothetical protein